MRHLAFLSLLVSLLSPALAQAQARITPEEAPKHIGEQVILCGKVYGGIYLAQKEKQPTFLNMGADYPNHLVTILIWGTDRKNFTYKPEEQWRDRNVCVTGKLVSYKGKPEIIVTDEKQLQGD